MKRVVGEDAGTLAAGNGFLQELLSLIRGGGQVAAPLPLASEEACVPLLFAVDGGDDNGQHFLHTWSGSRWEFPLCCLPWEFQPISPVPAA